MGGYCPWPLVCRFDKIIGVEVRGNISFHPFCTISRLISFPSYLNNDEIIYLNFSKKSTLRLPQKDEGSLRVDTE
jgi:hypothetical protein